MVLSGQALDRDAGIAAIEGSPSWDEWKIGDSRALGADGAVLTYRWRSRRGDARYAALMSSVYTRRDGAWQLVLHQHTPQPS